VAFLWGGCKVTEGPQKPSDTPPLLMGKWKVSTFEFKDGRVMPGAYMGFPVYEFTQDGYRIKTLNTEPSPPPDTVPYQVLGDSIYYPIHPTYPRMKIHYIQKDSLVLSNDKLSWYLYK
jgi:hypothetical protein